MPTPVPLADCAHVTGNAGAINSDCQFLVCRLLTRIRRTTQGVARLAVALVPGTGRGNTDGGRKESRTKTWPAGTDPHRFAESVWQALIPCSSRLAFHLRSTYRMVREGRECFCLKSSCDPVALHYHGQLVRRDSKEDRQVGVAFRIERSSDDDASAHALEFDFGRFRGIAEIYHHARQASIVGFERPENGIADISISLNT